MGSSQNKDQHIDLYMEVNKPYYTAGEYVEGCIYLNAKQTRNYKNLVVELSGEEYVFWKEGTSKNRRKYRNRFLNYSNVFTITDFHGSVQKGQYIYPFSFLLPASMTASFIVNNWCYIRYSLKVAMNHPTNQKDSQIYSFFLNIMEPPRAPIEPMLASVTTSVRCCGCCCDYGNVIINVKADKNYALSGDTINITGNIDNSQSSANVSEGLISLEERRVIISKAGLTRFRFDNQYNLGQIGAVGSGQNFDFNFQAVIPEKITSYTAIGRVTARYFVIGCYVAVGCCTTPPQAEMHIVIHSKTPNIEKQEKVQPPLGWSPNQSAKVTCNNMRPFVYAPHPSIPFHNLPKSAIEGLKMVDPNQGMQPQFQEHEETNNQLDDNYDEGFQEY